MRDPGSGEYFSNVYYYPRLLTLSDDSKEMRKWISGTRIDSDAWPSILAPHCCNSKYCVRGLCASYTVDGRAAPLYMCHLRDSGSF